VVKGSLLISVFLIVRSLNAQENTITPRPLTLEEYEKAKTFTIKNLDTDSYVKFENQYILDRYEMRKPYFITGEDELKKRIDLYRLIAKEGKQELGLIFIYTNEKGKQFQACLPNFTADASVWKKYFEDIHAIDREEKNFVLKLSYVLSKELGFQFYKSLNQGKDLSKESLTYGNDICFPGDQTVMMEDGTSKGIENVKKGERIVSFDPVTNYSVITEVEDLVVHEPRNYAIIKLSLIHADEQVSSCGYVVTLDQKEIEATPNHPVKTQAGNMEIKYVKAGDVIVCRNDRNNSFQPYTVTLTNEGAKDTRRVYNIVTNCNASLLLNGVTVNQK
jgi:hypothetical protein